jgi:hypothetical protein
MKVIKTLHMAHLFHKVSLFFTVISEHINTFPFWHQFRPSRNPALHSKPFTNRHFHFLTTVQSRTSQVFLKRPKRPLLQGVILRHDNATPHSARWTRTGVAAVASLQISGTSTLLLRRSLSPQLIRNWKWLFVNGCEYNGPICTVMGFLNSSRNETNALSWAGTVLKNNDTSRR